MGQDELDVLLATGLARSISARTSTCTPDRLLLAGLVPLTCLTLIVCWMHHFLPVGIPLALALWAVVVWCWAIGPHGVNICRACLGLCQEIIAEEGPHQR